VVWEVRGATGGTDQGKERGGRRFDVHVHDSGAQHVARTPPGLKLTGGADHAGLSGQGSAFELAPAGLRELSVRLVLSSAVQQRAVSFGVRLLVVGRESLPGPRTPGVWREQKPCRLDRPFLFWDSSGSMSIRFSTLT